ncbi:MAG: CBS domain-containing protein [Pyrinomonadaceae bacterium]|nr:CBS domain-containing protein [Pyrinomonadaceae bacterium]
MKVKDAMKTDVAFCLTDDSLMKAADTMRMRDCGVVPIVDDARKAVGMLTDRDICLAIAARNRKASDVKTSELIKGKIIACFADDDLESALRKMRKYRVKRLAVVDTDNVLVGICSIADALLAVGKDKKLKKKIYTTIKSIVQPSPIVLREIGSGDGTPDTDALIAASKSRAEQTSDNL